MRWVFKCFLKDIDDADVTFSGRVFHSRAAATGKTRSPMVERRVFVNKSGTDMLSLDICDWVPVYLNSRELCSRNTCMHCEVLCDRSF